MSIDIVAIARRENLTIMDWVEYHRQFGVKHIHIFDNNDKGDDSLPVLLKPYVDLGFVTVHDDYKGLKVKQIECYNSAIKYNLNGGYADWIALIDCDEYLTLGNGVTDIDTYLSDTKERCSNIGVLCLNWVCYTANHQILYSPRPVTERFTEKFSHDDRINTHVKSLVLSGCNALMGTPHDAKPLDGKFVYDSTFNRVSVSPFHDIKPEYPLYIRHYVAKSLQEFMFRKYGQGGADQSKPYNIDFFYGHCGDPEFFKPYVDIVKNLINANA